MKNCKASYHIFYLKNLNTSPSTLGDIVAPQLQTLDDE
jgi:hypothetical protein